MLSDLKLAASCLRRSPGFTVPALLTRALGIGANTAMFSIIDALMLRPLPFRDPERLALLWESLDDVPSLRGMKLQVGDYELERWSALSRSFESMGGYAMSRVTAPGAGGPERVDAMHVSGDRMRVLGYQPMLGRSSSPPNSAKGPRASRSWDTATGSAASAATAPRWAAPSRWTASRTRSSE